MPKLNPPQHRTRSVVVIRPVVDDPDHPGEYWVFDLRDEYEEDWIKPDRYSVGVPDPVTGLRATVKEAIGARPYGLFLARRISDEWKFLRHLPHRQVNLLGG